MDWLSATALADLAGTTVADRAFMACYRRQQELVPSLSASDPLKVAQPDADLSGHERRNRAALTRAGARPIGLDLSEGQLAHARRLLAQAGVHVPLVQVSAEAVPLADASFDIVFCDHGAMNFADPYRTVPEVARLLRPGRLFAFCHLSPIADRVDDQLVRDYFGMHRIDAVDEVVRLALRS